jgi:hypothetical protein
VASTITAARAALNVVSAMRTGRLRFHTEMEVSVGVSSMAASIPGSMRREDNESLSDGGPTCCSEDERENQRDIVERNRAGGGGLSSF